MPIYVYQCSACQHTQDVLQKISDPLLTVCPQCDQETYVKQVTAAGFQLKGSGWYATDFKDGGSNTEKPATTSGSAEPAASPATAPATESSSTAS